MIVRSRICSVPKCVCIRNMCARYALPARRLLKSVVLFSHVSAAEEMPIFYLFLYSNSRIFIELIYQPFPSRCQGIYYIFGSSIA